MATAEENIWQVRLEKDEQYRRQLSTLCKELRASAISNIAYFENLKGVNNERFYVSFVHLYEHLDSGIEPGLDEFIKLLHQYDFDPSLPANGYRSIISVVHKCLLKILHLTRYISVNKDSFLFRGSHYSKEIDAYVSTLGQLRACMYYIEQLQYYSYNGQLFPDEDLLTPEQLNIAERLMTEVESLSQETFYGRCLGFQFCNSMVKPLTTINLVLASFGDGYDQQSSLMKIASSVMGGGKYFLDPDSRAQQVVNVTRNGDIRFCKAFWSLAENELMHNLPLIVCPPVAIDKVIVLEPEPFDIPLADQSDIFRISPPCAHSGPGPVYTRLLSFEMREGQECWRPMKKNNNGTKLYPPSPNLIIQIHGGGFVAQSSASHQTYLRHWAKDLHVPILCIDYSLAPDDPFPRQLEEVFFAYCWALKYCHLLGSTAERICMVGDSAGANLCVTTTLRAASFGLRVPDAILSIYGSMLVKYTPSPSRMLSLMDPLLPVGILSKCLAAYAGVGFTSVPTTPVATPTSSQDTLNTPIGSGAAYQMTMSASSDNANQSRCEKEDEPVDCKLEQKSVDLTADIKEAMWENEPQAKNNDDVEFHDIEDSVAELQLSSPSDDQEGSPKYAEFQERMHSLSSGDSIVLESQGSAESSPSRQLSSPKTVESNNKTHKYTPSIDSGYQGSTKGSNKVRTDFTSEESSADESAVASSSTSPSENISNMPELVTQMKQGANEFNDDHSVPNKSLSQMTASVESGDGNDQQVRSGLNLDFSGFLRKRKQSSTLKRSPSSPIFNSLQQKLKMKDKIRVKSPVSPSSPFLGSDGILSATTPTYAKIRHFAQSPVQHFKHLPISRNPYMSPYLASPELLQDLCPMYFVVSHLDPLLDDSIQFAKKLRDIGKEVHIECVEDLPHGFLNFVLTSAEAKQASDLCVQKLCDILGLNDVTDEEWEILDEGLQNGELDDLLDDELDDLEAVLDKEEDILEEHDNVDFTLGGLETF